MKKQQSFIPFVKLKRRQRCKKMVALRWLIHQNRNGRGFFLSDHYIPNSPDWNKDICSDEDVQWADLYFVSRRYAHQGYFYNATIRTLADEYVENLDNEAYDNVFYQMSKSDQDKLNDISFENNTISSHFSDYFSSLNGSTFYAMQANFLEQKLLNLNQKKVFSSVTKDETYRYGIGLDMVIDDVSITVESIVKNIKNFYDNDEKNIMYEVPIDKHLPAISALLKYKIWVYRNMDNYKKCQKKLPIPSLSESEKRFFHDDSVQINLK